MATMSATTAATTDDGEKKHDGSTVDSTLLKNQMLIDLEHDETADRLKQEIMDLEDIVDLEGGGVVRRSPSLEFGRLPDNSAKAIAINAAATPPPKRRKNVTFATVTIREYKQTVGVNPFCSYGCPISLDWEYEAFDPIDFHEYEATRPPRRSRRGMLTSYYQRRDTLLLSGHSMEELEKAAKESGREKFRRGITLTFLPVFILEEKAVLVANQVFRGKDKSIEELCDELSASGTSSHGEYYLNDVEAGSSSSRGIMRRSRNAMDSSIHSLRGSFRDSLGRSMSGSIRQRSVNAKRHRSLSDTEQQQPSNHSEYSGSGSSQSQWEPRTS